MVLADGSRMRRALRAPLAALLLAAVVLPASAGAPADVEAVGPLPKCRLDDIMTVPRDYDSWSTTLVDWLLRVPRRLQAAGPRAGQRGGHCRPGASAPWRSTICAPWRRAAARNGTPDIGQQPLPQLPRAGRQLQRMGQRRRLRRRDHLLTAPRPLEHQLGLTIDFMTLGGGSALQGDWATDPSGAWMAENAWRYGWLMSYPLGDNGELFNQRTCFHYEPWHYRYLGRAMARKVHNSGLTIREYLWKHYTMVDPRPGSRSPPRPPRRRRRRSPRPPPPPALHRPRPPARRPRPSAAGARRAAACWASIRSSSPRWAWRSCCWPGSSSPPGAGRPRGSAPEIGPPIGPCSGRTRATRAVLRLWLAACCPQRPSARR